MAKPEFSETQFTFGFLRELFERNRSRGLVAPYFMFPTQNIERYLPVDFFVDYYSHSEYYQFKRSHHYRQRRGATEIRAGLPASYLPYYCFGVYNRTVGTTLGQFEMLAQLAKFSPGDLVCYCAPCFHTEWDYLNHFFNNTIIDNSIIIECAQFNDPRFKPPNFDINDGLNHNLVFQLATGTGYLCSEPKKVAVSTYGSLQLPNYYEESNTERFNEYVNKIYNNIYIRDQIKMDIPKSSLPERTSQRIRLIQEYLLAVYDIIWQPIFRFPHG